MLLAEIEGEDQYDADEPELLEMVSMLVALQVLDRPGRRPAPIGLPDWRGPALTARIADVVGRRAAELTDDRCRRPEAFLDGLPAAFAGNRACGIPDTLVHGDYHSGNVRGRPAG